jgi:probable F420-dependent oxidoreductase
MALEFGVCFVSLEMAKLRDLSQAAEGLGYGLLVVGDHLLFEQAGAHAPQEPAYDPMLTVAMIAQATRTVRVGHMVLNNLFRHPAITAQSLATLDHVTGGRIVAGLGAGWTETEFRASGIPFPEIKTRLEMLDEAFTCIRALFTEEQANFNGKYYQLRDAALWPKPVQKPYPPMLTGGGGRPLLRIAAKHCDEVNIAWELGRAGRFDSATLAQFDETRYRQRVAFLRDETVNCGRARNAVKVSNMIGSAVVTDSTAATVKTVEMVAKALGFTPEQARRCPMNLIGTPEECIAELSHRAKEWEATQFVFTTRSEKTMRVLAEKVFPYVA